MTPGTYLRKRRQAAGLSIDDVARTLASLPIARGPSIPVRREMLKCALIRIEGNSAVLHPTHAKVVRSAFPFDLGVYMALALTQNGRFADLRPRLCRICACSEADPCCEGSETCNWSDSDPMLCSNCEEVIDPRQAVRRQPTNAFSWENAL